MRIGLLFAVCLSSLTAFSQRLFEFEMYLNPPVYDGGDSIVHAFAGGMNNPQFSDIDLNFDGIPDLVVFDRDGNQLTTFIATGSPNLRYEFAPEYVENFPPLINFLLIVDYNCDGKPDLFTDAASGIGVYENISQPGNLEFQWALGTEIFLRTLLPNGVSTNVYLMDIDLPHIGDVDGDGDIDILSFALSGAEVYFYENRSTTGCDFDFELTQSCWGGFLESFSDNSLNLGACTGNIAPPPGPEDVQHAGSTILSYDLNGDGLQEVLLGDISFNTITAGINTGAPDSAYVSSQIIGWGPDSAKPVDLYVFPALFSVDVNFDSIDDIIAAPNSISSKNRNQVWLYGNTGSNANPEFDFVDSAFIVGDMIDLGEGAHPVFVDLNNDGKEDIVIGNRGVWVDSGNYVPELWYLENTSVGTDIRFELVTENLVSFAGLGNPLSGYPTFGDLDNDFDYDMVLGLEDGTLAYFRNDGTPFAPNFVLAQANYASIDVGSFAAPELYDIDGDGVLDLIIGEMTGTLNYYRGLGNGTYTLESDRFGGINRDQRGTMAGHSMPRMYEFGGREMLMVGSENAGVAQYDSATTIINLPSILYAFIGQDTLQTTGHDETPYGASGRTGRNQMLYRASELTAQGLTHGQIEEIGFNVSSTETSGSITSGIVIRMKNVSINELTGFETNLEQVYDYSMPIGQGWNNVVLQTPFVWDGTSNLLIEICFSRNLPLVDNQVYATDVGFQASAFGNRAGWNTNAHDGCQMPFKGTTSLRPNLSIIQRPIAPYSGEVVVGGRRTNADFSDLDGDGYPETVIGNHRGGVMMMKGKATSIGLPEEMISDSRATVYPNPTDGSVQVELTGFPKDAAYVIYDLNGRQMAAGEWTANPMDFDLSDWGAGMYIIHIQDGKRVHYGKIIVR